MRDGERLRGSVYAPESAYLSSDAERVGALLEDERRFIPFLARAPERFFVLNKSQLLALAMAHDEDVPAFEVVSLNELEGGGETESCCELWLEGGTRVEGRIAVLSRPESSRIPDKLNRAGRFVAVVGASGLCFVSCDGIVRIAERTPAWLSSTD
jgi:hypothetical protein